MRGGSDAVPVIAIEIAPESTLVCLRTVLRPQPAQQQRRPRRRDGRRKRLALAVCEDLPSWLLSNALRFYICEALPMTARVFFTEATFSVFIGISVLQYSIELDGHKNWVGGDDRCQTFGGANGFLPAF